jgi:hypothetical protein
MLYAYVNYSKFGTLFGLPLDKQDLLLRRPERRASLAASNQLFSLDYAPTNLLQYLRPDAIGFDRMFPWVTFSAPPRVIGGVTFDNIEPSASITAVSTLLVVLAILGALCAIRGSRPATGEATAATLRIPIVAGTLGTVGTILLGVQFHRYEGDFVPPLVISAAAGLFFLPAFLTGRGRTTRNLVALTLVTLAIWSCWSTFALTLRYQRAYSALQPTPVRAGFVSFQLDVNDALGLGPPSDVRRGSTLPFAPAGTEFRRKVAPLGTLFVLGDCEGLYLSSRRGWEAVEERPPGSHRWRTTLGLAAPGTREPLWSTQLPAPLPNHILWARWRDERHIVIELEWTGAPDAVTKSNASIRIEPGRRYDLDVRLDPNQHYVEVKSGKRLLLMSFPSSFAADRPNSLGHQEDPFRGRTSLNGSIRELPTTPICDRLVGTHTAREAPTRKGP